ncbi:hypothetical protein ACFSEO_11190 [Agromyces cerinus subsp. nitratus]|uniref:hypothetical protein n=1 Tax=Agromyces cerinus TaxID=33878 RepID=UPI003635C585
MPAIVRSASARFRRSWPARGPPEAAPAGVRPGRSPPRGPVTSAALPVASWA